MLCVRASPRIEVRGRSIAIKWFNDEIPKIKEKCKNRVFWVLLTKGDFSGNQGFYGCQKAAGGSEGVVVDLIEGGRGFGIRGGGGGDRELRVGEASVAGGGESDEGVGRREPLAGLEEDVKFINGLEKRGEAQRGSDQ